VTNHSAHVGKSTLRRYEQAQALARESLVAIAGSIRPGATEASLLADCRRLMDAGGATGYWWFGMPAVVLAGPRLRCSVEGDVFEPAHTPIAPDDMVTIDVAPEIDGFFLKGGVLATAEEAGPEQAEGMAAEAALHAQLLDLARPAMTFRDLHGEMDAQVRALGFENLDFLANYGHDIGEDLHNRAFIDATCVLRLDSVPMFTFEPHIARPGSHLAFKYEEVYRFEEGRLRLL
jgi:methionyl aminopeptidase